MLGPVSHARTRPGVHTWLVKILIVLLPSLVNICCLWYIPFVVWLQICFFFCTEFVFYISFQCWLQSSQTVWHFWTVSNLQFSKDSQVLVWVHWIDDKN